MMNQSTLAQIRATAQAHAEEFNTDVDDVDAGPPPVQSDGMTDKEFATACRRWARPFLRYVCPSCEKNYEDKYEAEDCCPRHIDTIYIDASTGKEFCSASELAHACKSGIASVTNTPIVPSRTCPVCGEKSTSPHEAVECCLWKDLDAPTRWKVAAALEAGSTWTEELAKLEGAKA